MKRSQVAALLALLLYFATCARAATIVYRFKVIDDAGALVVGANCSVNTIRSFNAATLGNAVAGPTFVIVDMGNGDYATAYDPEGSNGELLVNLSVTKVGSTITGQNASITLGLTRDSSRVLNADSPISGVKSDTATLTGRVPQTLVFTGSNINAAAQNLPGDFLSGGEQGQLTAIKAQTDKLGFSGTGPYNVNAVNSGTITDPLTTALTSYTTPGTAGYLLAHLLFDGNGYMKSAIYGYNTGLDPFTQVWHSTEGYKVLGVTYGSFTRDVTTGVTTYFLSDGSTLVLTPTYSQVNGVNQTSGRH